MRAYIQKIDITEDGKVIVSGQLSRTNLVAKLSPMIYVHPPKDGIWGYTLEVLPTSVFGSDKMEPFSVEAPWTGNNDANGVRITQPRLNPSEKDIETVQLKAKKVEEFTKEQSNLTILKGASFDKETNNLVVDLQYSGGCFPHLFSLEWDGISYKSAPLQYNFKVVDLSDYDPCRAMLSAQLRFDISTPKVQIDRPSVIHLGTVNGGTSIPVDIE